jgi:hypothetical protein
MRRRKRRRRVVMNHNIIYLKSPGEPPKCPRFSSLRGHTLNWLRFNSKHPISENFER